MTVLIAHLTRLRPGSICVAGIDPATGESIRPELKGSLLPRGTLLEYGGIYDIAVEVDLGPLESVGVPPHTEDRAYSPYGAKVKRSWDGEDFWRELRRLSTPRLRDLFGDDLALLGHNAVLTEGRGTGSLGILAPIGLPRLFVNDKNQIRLAFSDSECSLDLSVTDLRLYREDQQTPREKVVRDIAIRIDRGVAVLLSVGLTRAWRREGDTQARHWVQVNNLHLADQPAWRHFQARD